MSARLVMNVAHNDGDGFAHYCRIELGDDRVEAVRKGREIKAMFHGRPDGHLWHITLTEWDTVGKVLAW
jgi:hypothetical protein